MLGLKYEKEKNFEKLLDILKSDYVRIEIILSGGIAWNNSAT